MEEYDSVEVWSGKGRKLIDFKNTINIREARAQLVYFLDWVYFPVQAFWFWRLPPFFDWRAFQFVCLSRYVWDDSADQSKYWDQLRKFTTISARSLKGGKFNFVIITFWTWVLVSCLRVVDRIIYGKIKEIKELMFETLWWIYWWVELVRARGLGVERNCRQRATTRSKREVPTVSSTVATEAIQFNCIKSKFTLSKLL